MEMMKKLSFGTVWFWPERLLEIQNTRDKFTKRLQDNESANSSTFKSIQPPSEWFYNASYELTYHVTQVVEQVIHQQGDWWINPQFLQSAC